MSTYTLATLKSAVVEAAIASDQTAFANVSDRKSFIKAVKTCWTTDKFDFRQWKSWNGFATYLGIDCTPWQQAKATKDAAKNSPKLKDLKAYVLSHYEAADTKTLKKKLIEWGIPFSDLRLTQSWSKLWDEVQAHYQIAA